MAYPITGKLLNTRFSVPQSEYYALLELVKNSPLADVAAFK